MPRLRASPVAAVAVAAVAEAVTTVAVAVTVAAVAVTVATVTKAVATVAEAVTTVTTVAEAVATVAETVATVAEAVAAVTTVAEAVAPVAEAVTATVTEAVATVAEAVATVTVEAVPEPTQQPQLRVKNCLASLEHAQPMPGVLMSVSQAGCSPSTTPVEVLTGSAVPPPAPLGLAGRRRRQLLGARAALQQLSSTV